MILRHALKYEQNMKIFLCSLFGKSKSRISRFNINIKHEKGILSMPRNLCHPEGNIRDLIKLTPHLS